MKFLQENLEKINKNLPSTTYIPILSKFHRNNMILNIAEEETRLFITNTKAPYLIYVEVFQPLELEIAI